MQNIQNRHNVSKSTLIEGVALVQNKGIKM